METLEIGINVYKGYIVEIGLTPKQKLTHISLCFKPPPEKIYYYETFGPDGSDVDSCICCPENELNEIEQEILTMIEFDIKDSPRFMEEKRKEKRKEELMYQADHLRQLALKCR